MRGHIFPVGENGRQPALRVGIYLQTPGGKALLLHEILQHIIGGVRRHFGIERLENCLRLVHAHGNHDHACVISEFQKDVGGSRILGKAQPFEFNTVPTRLHTELQYSTSRRENRSTDRFAPDNFEAANVDSRGGSA